MGDAAVVQVLHGFGQLPQHFPAVLLGKPVAGLLLDGGAKRDAGQVLHHDVDVVVGLNHVHDLHDVGVVHHLQDLYFPAHRLLALLVLDLHLLVGLYRDLAALRLVDRHSHRCIRALADHLAHHVVLLELERQVDLLSQPRDVLLLAKGRWQASQHPVELVVHSQELDGGKVPAQRRQFSALVAGGLGLEFGLLFGLAEELVEVLFSHEVADFGVGPHAASPVLVEPGGAYFPRGVEVGLPERVDEFCSGCELFLALPGEHCIVSPHNDINNITSPAVL